MLENDDDDFKRVLPDDQDEIKISIAVVSYGGIINTFRIRFYGISRLPSELGFFLNRTNFDLLIDIVKAHRAAYIILFLT